MNGRRGATGGSWPELLAAALEAHERAVMVTVADARGSTPRESGAAMVVTAEATAGTIGGGRLEHEAVRLAREALAGTGADATPPATWLVRFPLAIHIGPCCGGVATLAFQTIARDAAAWLATARACQRTAAPFALLACVGSGAHAATRLLVTADDARGTLGDAGLDSAAIAAARERLGSAGGPGIGTGIIALCGATLLVHIARPTDFSVVVFGNGHVGRALVHILGALPAHVAWVDEREQDFPSTVPDNVEIVVTDTPEAEVRAAPAGSYLVIVTHSHALDFDIAAAALVRQDWRYVGMIGSKTKRAQLERRLAERGLPPEASGRVACPIGASVGSVRSKEPGAIAVVAVAEMLAVREAGIGVQAGAATAATALRTPWKNGV